uniref:Uncharacterized protein n=1 Tax=Cucumis melo TaxID=3656 RepID=A0A9I9EF93_CUCME
MFKDGSMLCSEGLQIREFIVNLPSDFYDPSSPDYQTVHIRGLKFKISLAMINGFMGNNVEPNSSHSNPSNKVLALVLSGGILSAWPVNGIPVGNHVPDIEHDMRPSRAPRMFDTEDLGVVDLSFLFEVVVELLKVNNHSTPKHRTCSSLKTQLVKINQAINIYASLFISFTFPSLFKASKLSTPKHNTCSTFRTQMIGGKTPKRSCFKTPFCACDNL